MERRTLNFRSMLFSFDPLSLSLSLSLFYKFVCFIGDIKENMGCSLLVLRYSDKMVVWSLKDKY